jgi:hypothetical protein
LCSFGCFTHFKGIRSFLFDEKSYKGESHSMGETSIKKFASFGGKGPGAHQRRAKRPRGGFFAFGAFESIRQAILGFIGKG